MAYFAENKTITLINKPGIVSYASVVGKKESQGPLSGKFDKTSKDSLCGEKTFEKAESRLQKLAIDTALKKCLEPP